MALDRYDNPGGGRGGYPPRRSFSTPPLPGGGGILERIPPQNIEAEMAVLGAMLLGDRGAIEKATEALSRDDFYREAHSHIFDAMIALTEQDEPVDIVTLKDELNKKGILEGVGGYAYLMQLAEFVPTTANVAYYANIVREKSILRRLIEAASEIAGLAYGEVEEVERLVDMAERTIFEIGARRQTKAFNPLRPLLNEAFEKIDTLYHEKGVVTGIDTGFEDLNYVTSGLQPGDLFILAARPSMGKCLAAWSLIDDPATGARLTIEQFVQQRLPLVLNVGECGGLQTTRISDWIDSGVKPCWRVTTRSGRSVEVTGHHPFLTVRGWTPLHDIRVGQKIAVPRAVPIFGNDDSLPLEQVRLLATRLAGTGNPTDAYEHGPTKVGGGESAFPAFVWRWPREHLAVFLEALLCYDAKNGGGGELVYTSSSERMARDLHHALVRFGVVAVLAAGAEGTWSVTAPAAEVRRALTPGPSPSLSLRDGRGEEEGLGKAGSSSDGSPHASVTVPPLPSRSDNEGEGPGVRAPFLASPDLYWDEVVAIEPIGEHQVYDLTVPDGANFIAQDVCVHNTALAMAIGQNAALRAGATIAVFSLEMGANQLVQRMICSEARVDGNKMRTGFLHDDDWDRLAQSIQRLWDANIFIDDTTEMSAMEMRAKCRRLKAEHGTLDLIIVDYLQLMRSSAKNAGNRNEEITEISRGLKNLAREMKAPVIALAQLSRAVERREDKRPMLSDLRDSGAIEAEADVVAFIYRPAYYERKEAVSQEAEEEAQANRRPGEYDTEESEVIIAKQRNGPTGTVKLAFMPRFARFDNLAEYREENQF